MRASVGAKVLFTIWLAIAATATVFAILNRPLTSDLGSLDSVDFVYVVGSVALSAVSALVGLVITGRTRHAIGWLLLVFANTIVMPLVFEQYAFYGIVANPGSLPATVHAEAVAFSSFALVAPSLLLILLLFPTGTPRSARWRLIVYLTPVVAVLYAIAGAIQRVSAEPVWHEVGVRVENPLEIHYAEWVRFLAGISGALIIGLFFAAVVSLVLRFRKSTGVERQQIKWLAYVAIAAGLTMVFITAVNFITGGTSAEDAVGSIGRGILVTTILVGLPVAIGFSVLRYRLYDIDRIISRTLSYALLTALLGALFAIFVIVPTILIGGERRPDWVVALATLTVAVLFGPVRKRVQGAVDHRFNRRRYDAELVIDTFAHRLREQVDIDALGHELTAVVHQTIHPKSISLWLNATR